MYINVEGNVICTCFTVSKPEYFEEYGEKRSELTRIGAKAKQSSPDGTMTVNVELLFYANRAIPAAKLNYGESVIVLGRESSREVMKNHRMVITRTVLVDWWFPQIVDPLNYLQELSVRREMDIRNREFRENFWDFLNAEGCKELIHRWVQAWIEEEERKKDEHT